MNTPAQTVALPGTSRFELLRKLGQGGMGVVYEAFDRERNARVALKTLTQLTPESLRRFKNEFRSLQDIKHPNLVALDELFEVDGLWFFTMELVHGTNFLHHVRPPTGDLDPAALQAAAGMSAFEVTNTIDTEEAPDRLTGSVVVAPLDSGGDVFDEARLRDALRQVVSGLAALHAANKVHRDVKPANILVTDEGRVVILDFGLVMERGQLDKRAVGTVAYMAPEQVTSTAVGPAADWYAVGVTLYRALTGAFPFSGTSEEVMERKVLYDAPPPGAAADDVPGDLDDLCMDLLRREPRQRPAGPAILARLGAATAAAPAAAPVAAAPFVGRDRELTSLADAFAHAAAGHTVAVLVHGESGVGKSALVRHFVDGLADGNAAVVLGGRCYERESVPYKAVDQVMEALARHLEQELRRGGVDLLPDRFGLIADVFPAFAPVQTLAQVVAPTRRPPTRPDARAIDPMQSRSFAFAAIRELLVRLGRRQRIAIAIDDLQWADADSLSLLGELLAPPDAPAILLCATVRAPIDAEGPILAALASRLGDDVRTLPVLRLPPADARALTRRLLSSMAGELGVDVDELASEAGGHPLFIDALVRHRVAHPRDAGPVRLDDALVARTGGLADDSRRLLELVCIAGVPIQQEACAHAAAIPFGDFVQQVAALRAANLVKTHGIHRGDWIEPYHDRVREAVAAGVGDDLRRDLHARLARALEASGQADPEILAVHLQAAGDLKRAARFFARAADRAEAALAFDRAARLYRLALELDPGTPSQAQRLRIRLGDALACSGRAGDAGATYLEAAAATTDEAQVLELRRLAAEQYLRAGRLDDAFRTFGDVLTTAGLKMPATRGRAVAAFVWERIKLRRRGLAFQRRDDSELAPALRHRLDVLASMYPLGMSDTLRGHRFQMLHLRLALDAGVAARISKALATEIVFLSTKGLDALPDFERHTALGHQIVDEVGAPYLAATLAGAECIAFHALGRFRDSLRRSAEAEAIIREQCEGAAWELDSAQIYGMRSRFFLGEIAEIRQRMPAVLREAHERGDLFLSTNLRVGFPMAHACLAQGDAETARRHSEEAIREWSREGTHLQHIHALHGEVSVDLYTGELEQAERRIAEAWPRLTKAMYLRMQAQRILCTHLRGRVALARAKAADGRERERHLAAAARDARAIAKEHAPWGHPLATLLDAGGAAIRGDAATAVARLADADEALRRFELMLYAAAARRQRGRLVGGDEGAALIADADAWMAGQTIAHPDRFADLLVPGVG